MEMVKHELRKLVTLVSNAGHQMCPNLKTVNVLPVLIG